MFSPFITIILTAFVAGFLGTVCMTISQLIEIRITKRAASFTPAIIISRIFRIPFAALPEQAKMRLNWAVHVGYGTLLGLTVPILLLIGVKKPMLLYLATFAFVWGQGLVVVPILGGHPPPWRWGPKWIFIDAFHHAVLAIGSVLFYLLLTGGALL